jgi:aerobic carbon-monoxide dehydrogenase large subunit
MSILGTRVIRTEDPRLLTSGGVYVDDLRAAELATAARLTFVRSPVAHARITGIDTAAAMARPGVIAVLTAADMTDLPVPEPPDPGEPVVASEEPVPMLGIWREPLLAIDRVRYAGEPVAVVLTDHGYRGEDAAELVSVDYEQLPALVGPRAGLNAGTLLFPNAGTNVLAQRGRDTFDDAAFADCEITIEQDIVNQRLAAMPMESRATAAAYQSSETGGPKLTVWHSSQNAQVCRWVLCATLGMEPAQVRVIVPDVGGGFGAKLGIDRDALIVAWAARKVSGAVRWAETRSENLVGMTQGRAQLNHVKLGGGRDGKIKAYRIDVLQDTGAYPRMSAFLASMTCLMAPGVYDIPVVQTGYRVTVSNATPIHAYRGAGRPEAAAAIERAVDIYATAIGMDPAEVRRRNFIGPGSFPFQTKTGALYDSGDYERALDAVLTGASYTELRQEQNRRRAAGQPALLGIGISAYVEVTGADWALGETAKLEVHGDGTATVYSGSSAHGQGHHTAWAMLVQEELGIGMDQVTVIHGDTDLIPDAIGTYGSRSLQLGGSAVHKAAVEVKEEARQRAARMLEASVQDVVLDPQAGHWQVRGDPDTALTWAQVAAGANTGMLTADVRFTADRPTFPFGAHVAVVEVDAETGKVTLLRHVTVDDAGPVLNPVLAEGQRHGGIAQGAAQALLEEVRYDADANPLTSTLADYAAITATELPSFELLACETPTTVNPLGVKGIGEAGTIGATPAIQNAVVDALSHLGVRHIDMPATPERVWAAIQEATQ